MIIESFDTSEKVLIIAEIGVNHEGSYALAEALVGRAAESGADAVKFQTFETEHYISRKQKERFKRIKSFELCDEDFVKLNRVAREVGLLFVSTPLDLPSVKFLTDLVSAFKISSGDNDFFQLIEAIAKTGKPIILSGGLADIEELRRSKSCIQTVWREKGIEQELALLHCVSSYPVPPEEANLLAIENLRRELDCTIGYSDHTLGIDASVLAVALGARIIEKHFTIDRSYSDFRDHQLSADPQELKELVEKVREAEILLGSGEKKPQNCEQAQRDYMKRSIVAARSLKAGHCVSSEDITWTRPFEGLPPGKEGLVLGRTLLRDVEQGEPLIPELFSENKR